MTAFTKIVIASTCTAAVTTLCALALRAEPPTRPFIALPLASLAGDYEDGQKRMTTFHCDNRDGKAMLRIERTLDRAGAKFERQTERNKVFIVDSTTTVSVERPSVFLGKFGPNLRYRTDSGRTYECPAASLHGRSPARTSILVQVVQLKRQNLLQSWLRT